MLLNHLLVVFVWVAWINDWKCLPLSFQRRGAFLPKIFLKQHSVSSVGAKNRICNIPKKGNKPNAKIEDNVKIHFRFDLSWEAAFHFLACLEHHDSHEYINCVAKTEKLSAYIDGTRSLSEHIHRNYSNGIAPTDSDSTAVEQAHIEPVSASLDLGKDFAIVLRDTCRQGLTPFLSLQ
jgi:hypothetical protein